MRRTSAVLLASVAVTAWAAYGTLRGLPEVDDRGQSLLYVAYGQSKTWWSLAAFSVAAAASYALLLWTLWRLVRKTHGRRRGLASVAAASLALASGGVLAFVGGAMLLLVAVEGKQTLVQDADGPAVVVTQDAFDGEVVLVWRRVGRFTYVREQGPTTVDPDGGPCAVVDDASAAVLTCGPTSQVLLVS